MMDENKTMHKQLLQKSEEKHWKLSWNNQFYLDYLILF